MEATADKTALGQQDTPRRRASGTRKARVRYGAIIGQLGKGTSYLRRNLRAMWRAIERQVRRQPGRKIGLMETLTIQSALRAEQCALAVQRELRLNGDKMTPGERLAHLKAIPESSMRRDACLEKLGLQPGKPLDPWSIIDAPATSEKPEVDGPGTAEVIPSLCDPSFRKGQGAARGFSTSAPSDPGSAVEAAVSGARATNGGLTSSAPRATLAPSAATPAAGPLTEVSKSIEGGDA